ncbi:MAG: phosphatidylcholine/phosphatidylserine synthase [Puniceicoccales bacterium]|jgi:CDP-diacylglycerol--serine O-phosphatidyltransferase|nr:phosphatidylcholine/phosphatidylserine synthase [Puniceicoccales bacterium]
MTNTNPPFPELPPHPKYRTAREASRIYLLPNMFTAGNMLCGFLSIYSCIKAKYIAPAEGTDPNLFYRHAIYYILGACICDLFDGRVARAAKRESLFGLEFDSIADIISFGMAPALMICMLILNPTPNAATADWFASIGREFAWVFAFIYLLCVGVRLARFNVLTNPLLPDNVGKDFGSDFVGLPCPTAAGMIASIVLLITQPANPATPPGLAANLQKIAILCLPIVLLISFLMVSTVRYPSFKHINWNTRLKLRAFILLFLFVALSIRYYEYTIPVLFLAFILNGFVHTLRKKARERSAAAENPQAGLGDMADEADDADE